MVRTGVDFTAACCFLPGSAFFFFFSSLSAPADWLFLVGPVLFAIKPTIDFVRSIHLRRLPGGERPPNYSRFTWRNPRHAQATAGAAGRGAG